MTAQELYDELGKLIKEHGGEIQVIAWKFNNIVGPEPAEPFYLDPKIDGCGPAILIG